MSRQIPRRHRLPRHSDYVLIPASQSFTPPDEKSPLPAIIVTPSSPSSSFDFSIAFVAPPPKPTLRERITAVVGPLQTKARVALVLVLFLFVLATHLLAHRLATRHPHLQFDTAPASVTQDAVVHVTSARVPTHGSSIGWFDWQGFWQTDERDVGSRHSFIVTEVENITAENPGPRQDAELGGT